MARDGKKTLLDMALRLSGLVLALVAYLAIRHLAQDYPARRVHQPSPIDFACAAIGFLGMSASAVLTLLGRHVLDRVEISRRWARRPDKKAIDGSTSSRADSLCTDATPVR